MYKIKELRARHDMTQADLAQKLGVAQNTVCNWEKGSHNMPVRKLREMAQLFNVRMDEIELPFESETA